MHREQAAREEAEALLEEEVNHPLVSQRQPLRLTLCARRGQSARCEQLQAQIEHLQRQLHGVDSWRCPICSSTFPRSRKAEHSKECLRQLVEYVQQGAVHS